MRTVVIGFCVCWLALFAGAASAMEGAHTALECAACHAGQPVEGQPVAFLGGSAEKACAACHSMGSPPVTPAAVATLQSVGPNFSHPLNPLIPESMKQQMIHWWTANGYTVPYDPAQQWQMRCQTCHRVHGGTSYPSLLAYDMGNGDLCKMCHGGNVNMAPDWTTFNTRRIMYAPSNSGQLQADGATEVPVPSAPKEGDTVTSIVNFPVAVFRGFHSSSDTGYRISIPGSVFGEKTVSPADPMYWFFGADMISWDTTRETNGTYTVSIVPFSPSTLQEWNPVTFSLTVANMTTADKICTAEGKIRGAAIANEGIRNSLISKAASACQTARKDNLEASRGILQALINQLEAQKGKHLDPATADELIAFINGLLANMP